MALKITCPKCAHPHRITEPYPLPGDIVPCTNCAFALNIAYPPNVLRKLEAQGKRFRGEEQHIQKKKPVESPTPNPIQKDIPQPIQPRIPKPEPVETIEAQTARTLPEEKATTPSLPPKEPKTKPPKRKRSLLKRIFLFGVYSTLFLGAVGTGGGLYMYKYYADQVPTVEVLREYSPPTVTVVYDRNNKVLAEVYENRRYVTPFEEIPKHVQDAFIAAEDANFWNHTGVDYMGIVRAVVRNALKGKKAQGASTITQQVAKNFLLSSEKTYTRKIKEAILAQRIEETFDKKHILYLYLNQIYLGSSAYGVEAASRVYFDKHVSEITLAEAAILAGLPQRPSDYSPHANWEKARTRQMYVLHQLKEKNFVSAEDYEKAKNEVVRISKKENQFRIQAPYYTEHVRRYLVDTYGSKKIYNDGLEVVTACDLDLQKEAQESLKNNVERADRSSGWRGSLSFVGLGMELSVDNKSITVDHVEANSKAHKAGIQSGDTILISNTNTDIPKRILLNELRKAQGKTTTLTVLRKKNEMSIKLEVPKITEEAIAQWRTENDEMLRKDDVANIWFVADPDSGKAGPHPLPEKSTIHVGKRYKAIVTKVTKDYFMIGIGNHTAMIPNVWSKWTYDPNPLRSYRNRYNNDMTSVVDVGDIVSIELSHDSMDTALSDKEIEAAHKKLLKKYQKEEKGSYMMAQLLQPTKMEGAIFSYRMTNSKDNNDQGAVLAMVGGTDFGKSEYNRATQAIRQVGSTFKPIVYAAAIESRQFTTASILPDLPLTYATIGNKLWKPGNYGGDFLGNITLRKALMLSRNSCTVLVLENLSWEKIYEMAGPKLGIGFSTPTCTRQHIANTEICQGTSSPSLVPGMQWCEHCIAESCSLVAKDRTYIKSTSVPDNTFSCIEDPITKDDGKWCRSCDVNLRVCAWLDLEELSPKDSCIDARMENGKIKCRSCDMSMGLGSSSLTMVELARAYTAFGTYGSLVEPYFIEKVLDRDGTIIEEHKAIEPKQVLDPSVAYITHWLLTQVATGGTAASSNKLKLSLAGKTGTTNDEIDAWFVGYNPDIIAAAWVGYDQPHPMGVSFTGGNTALPIWMDYMAAAVPKDDPEKNRSFPMHGGVSWVKIDETTGMKVLDGVSMPMLPGTEPTNVAGVVGQKTTEDLLNNDW